MRYLAFFLFWPHFSTTFAGCPRIPTLAGLVGIGRYRWTLKPDHDYWQQFLARHLSSSSDGLNLLDYASAAKELQALNQYMVNLQAIPVSKLTRPSSWRSGSIYTTQPLWRPF